MSKAKRWAIVVRLTDGSRQYLCAPFSRQAGHDQWSPRASQARRFPTKDDADQVSAGFDVNSQAREYLVVEIEPSV